MKYSKGILSLLWVVFTDSLGWGIAFSVFAALILNPHSSFLSTAVSTPVRATLYESLLAVYSVFMFFFAPVIGGIADRYGRKPGLQISMLGLTLGFLLSVLGCYWTSLGLLVIGRIISGMTAGSLSVAQAAIVDMSTPETKASYLSVLVLANCLGFSLGPMVGGFLEHSHWGPVGTTTFLVGALMSALGFVAITFWFKETYVGDQSHGKLDIIKDFLNIKIAFSKPVVNYYLLTFLFSMVAYGLFFSNVPVFLNRLFATNTSTIGMVLGGFMILLSVSLMSGGKLVFRYFKEAKVVFSVQLIQLLIYLILIFCIKSFIFNCILFGFIALTVAQLYIGLLTLISNATEHDWQGRIMGVVASLFALTWGVGPLLAGFLNHFGVGAAFLGSALLVGLGFLVLQTQALTTLKMEAGRPGDRL